DFAVVASLGWAYYLSGAFDEARALVARATVLAGTEQNFEILDHLGDIYWRLNRHDEARATWREALRARPDALRRAAIEAKLVDGLTTPAPVRRPLPAVQMPSGQSDHT
ncbi:MAG: tetratricopeptide repeat protein, partial [Hyphomonadaceae bacterium]